jgi:hypothetical protein
MHQRTIMTAAAAGVAALCTFAPLAEAQVAKYCDNVAIPYGLQAGLDEASELRLDPVSRAADGWAVRYDNMQHHRRYFVANQHVKGVELTTSAFDLEPGYDTLTIGGETFSGVAPWSTRQFHTTYSFQASPLQILFKTDSSVTRPGFRLDTVRPICGTNGYNGDATTVLPAFTSVDGVLLGANDVVHVAFPPNHAEHATIALWVPSAQDADIDVLAACGRRPSIYDYDVASRSGGNVEFAHISSYCSGNWHVAIHSYGTPGRSGRATFRLMYSQHKASQDVTKTVGWRPVGRTPTAIFAEQNVLTGYLSRRAADIYAATDGQVLMSYKLYQVPGAESDKPWSETWKCAGLPCDVRMLPPGVPGGGQGQFSTGRMWLGHGYWGNENSAGGFLHEWGHSHLGLGAIDAVSGWDGYAVDDARINRGWLFPLTPAPGDDEIGNTIYNACGHSAMSNGWLPRVRHLCQAHNHLHNQRYVNQGDESRILMFDGTWDDASPAGTEPYSLPISLDGYDQAESPVERSSVWTANSDWEVAYQRGIFLYSAPVYTDDPYDFAEFVGIPGFPRAAP